MKEVMKYELTPMPLSIFHIDGGKSSLVWGESSYYKEQIRPNEWVKGHDLTRGNKPDVTILDRCAILWKIQWPSSDFQCMVYRVYDFIKGLINYIAQLLKNNNDQRITHIR